MKIPSVSGLVSNLRRFVWDVELESLPAWKAVLLHLIRIGYAIIRGVVEGQLSLRAMSLVYTTLLSLVPLLAISFSVLKGFGVHNQIEPVLLNLLEPLGNKGVEITERIIVFVENVKVGVLGSLGFALLFYTVIGQTAKGIEQLTVISLMQKIERAFNYTWHITRERSFGQRFRDYLSVIIVGPALVFASISITALFMNTSAVEMLSSIQPFGMLITFAGRLVPYLMIVAAFTFLFMFIPNTRVRLRSALIGGVVAGILWNSIGWIFASFVVGSTNYAAIYSTFATLIMFLIWLYLGWLILLLGASIAFYDQYPEQLAVKRGEMRLSNRVREKLGLLITHHIGNSFYNNQSAWTADRLASQLNTPTDAIESVLHVLEENGLLTKTGSDPAEFLPARPPENTPIEDILNAVRKADETTRLNPDRLPMENNVEQILDSLRESNSSALRGKTVKDLAVSDDDNSRDS